MNQSSESTLYQSGFTEVHADYMREDKIHSCRPDVNEDIIVWHVGSRPPSRGQDRLNKVYCLGEF